MQQSRRPGYVGDDGEDDDDGGGDDGDGDVSIPPLPSVMERRPFPLFGWPLLRAAALGRPSPPLTSL